jgi:putative FmdB family regulatory protein
VPTYEYACRGCGQHLEVVQSFKDDALTECPSCEGELRKVYSAAGLIFKGSGWHVKDYATSSRASSSSSSSDGGSSGSSDSGSSGSSDSGASGSGSSTSATSSASSTSSTADKKSA